MQTLNTYHQNTHDSSQETTKDVLEEWIKCRAEVNALNKKLLSLCKNDKELHWMQSRGLLNFLEH